MTALPPPPPEARLITELRTAIVPPLSQREAARRAGFSAPAWNQIEQGYRKVTAAVVIPVRGTDEKVARMALVVGATPGQLEAVDRPEAARMLKALLAAGPGPEDRIAEVIRQSSEFTEKQKAHLIDLLERGSR